MMAQLLVEKEEWEVGIVLEPMEFTDHHVLYQDPLDKTSRAIVHVDVGCFLSRYVDNV